MIKTSTGTIILVAAAIIFFGGSYTYANVFAPQPDYYLNLSYSSVHKTADAATKDWKTYTNDTYGFNFKYPKEWTAIAPVTSEPALGDLGNALTLKVQFYDPTNKQQIDCANNEFQNWSAVTPTKTDCEPILSGLTAAQKDKLTGPRSPQNIYTRVWKKSDTSTTLKDWLYNKFHKPNTELGDYQVGQGIKMASLDGYYSSIGCCANSDRNYVVEKNGYVYSLGTNYFENSITDTEMPAYFLQIANTLSLTTPNPIADWQTYTNSTYGFSFKYPNDWTKKENAGNNYDLSVVSITSPETQSLINESLKNGQNYGPYNNDISIYYYPTVADESENKSNKWGATTLDELVTTDHAMQKIGDITIGGTKGVDVLQGGEGVYYTVFLVKDNHLYKIFFNNIESKNSLTNSEKTILSTFQFIK